MLPDWETARGMPLEVCIYVGVEMTEDYAKVEESKVMWWVAPKPNIHRVEFPGVADIIVASELEDNQTYQRYPDSVHDMM